jgi:Uncharacterized alpha/beta hydrolase domain (DUF2235)
VSHANSYVAIMASSNNMTLPPQQPELLSEDLVPPPGNQPTYPKRRIIVACDGTWNASDLDGRALTNVARIARCIADSDDWKGPGTSQKNFISQIVHYQSGIGVGTGKVRNGWDAFTGRGTCPDFRGNKTS